MKWNHTKLELLSKSNWKMLGNDGKQKYRMNWLRTTELYTGVHKANIIMWKDNKFSVKKIKVTYFWLISHNAVKWFAIYGWNWQESLLLFTNNFVFSWFFFRKECLHLYCWNTSEDKCSYTLAQLRRELESTFKRH